jgi:tetratricopeptide (TPR) repeat protein
MFLTGRVLLEDGTPPPEPVAIQRVCTGSPYTEGYTNARGDFSITIGTSFPNVLQDATSAGLPGNGDPGQLVNPLGNTAGSQIASSTGLSPWFNCEIRAQLAGYQSQTVPLMNRQRLDNPNIGTILLHRIGQSEGTTVSATTLAAPKGARKAYEKGIDLIKKKKLEEAQASLTKAVEEYPRYAAAWTQLGGIAAAKGDSEAAHRAFDQAIQADPKFVVPYVQLSLLQMRAHQWKEVAETSEKALRLDPFTYPQAYFFNAVAHYNLQEWKAAEESARRAQTLDTRHTIPETSRLLSAILFERHDYSGAASQMRDYLKIAPPGAETDAARSQLEEFEKLATAQPAQPGQ